MVGECATGQDCDQEKPWGCAAGGGWQASMDERGVAAQELVVGDELFAELSRPSQLSCPDSQPWSMRLP